MSLLSVSSISNPSAPQANISLNADGSVTLPVYTGNTAPLLFQAGTLWYNTTGPALQIRNPANTSWVSITPPVAATLAEAAAGTLNTVYSSPLTSVPKDASGMTGAAILPSGTTLQQPATPVAGMTRYNTTTSDLEFYTGSAWNGATAKVVGSGAGATYDVGASLLPAGTTAQRPGSPVAGMLRFNDDYDGLEFYDSAKWVTLAPNVPACSVTSTSTAAITSAVFTLVPLPTVVFDNFGYWNAGTNRFQPLTPGYYQISAVVRAVFSNTTLTTAIATIYKNGADYQRFSEISPSAPGLAWQAIQLTGSTTVYMNGTTDYLELYCYFVAPAINFAYTPAQGAFSSFTAILVSA